MGYPMTISVCPHAEKILHAGICDCVYYNPRIPSNMLKKLKYTRVNPPGTCELQKLIPHALPLVRLYFLHVFVFYGLHLFTNVFTCACVCIFLYVCNMPI
jgi:hypothetical protein